MSFERLEQLKAKRAALQNDLGIVNAEIRQELDAMQERVAAWMREFDKRTPKARGNRTSPSWKRSEASKRAWAQKTPEQQAAWKQALRDGRANGADTHIQ